MKKIAIILSGCGNRDGSELQETLSLMLAIDKRNWQYQCFAPEGYFEVVRYTETDPDEDLEEGTIVDIEQRDIFEESARIARGNIKSISEFNIADYDALALPGGMGAARNLSTYAFEGPNMLVIDDVTDAILATYKAEKPILAMCIAPMVLAKVLGRYGIHITLGKNDCQAAEIARILGAITEECTATEAIADDEHKIYTTPAYMVGSRISEIFAGAESLVKLIDHE